MIATGQIEITVMDATEARSITDQIKTGIEVVWQLVSRAYTERAWTALGYSTWDDYCTREFGSSRLRLPREERAEIVSSLRDSGLSIRAITAVTGDGFGTIQRELAGDPNGSPDDGAVFDRAAEEATAIAEPETTTIDNTGQVISETPLPTITGIDGKNYPATPTPREPRRKALPEAFNAAVYELKRSIERVSRLAADDRFTKNKDQIEAANLSDLIRVQDALTGVIQQIKG